MSCSRTNAEGCYLGASLRRQRISLSVSHPPRFYTHSRARTQSHAHTPPLTPRWVFEKRILGNESDSGASTDPEDYDNDREENPVDSTGFGERV